MKPTTRFGILCSLVALLGLGACGDDSSREPTDAGMTEDADTPIDAGPDGGEPPTDGGVEDGGTEDAAVDPCDAIPMAMRCTTEGTTCNGDSLEVCMPNMDGCLVLMATDCAADGGSCDDTGATPLCTNDPCFGTSTCMAEGTTCDGDESVVCAPDGDGCLIETREACDSCAVVGDEAVCGGACAAAMTPLNCLSGAMTTTTVGGTTDHDEFCGRTGYASPERMFRFTDTRTANVVIRVTPTDPEADIDMDLFALNGGDGSATCDGDMECRDESRASGAEETVEFFNQPGEVTYIAYDAYTGSNPAIEGAGFQIGVTCTLVECGDGITASPEQCDDGNTDDGDGCSSTCQIETGYACSGMPSMCFESCGNGTIEGMDQCDDGNTTAGDGCSDTCQIEPGYSCDDAEPQVCTFTCGNGTRDGDDECDDGNTVAGDGCSEFCMIEPGYECTGTPSVCRESCGDGGIDSGERCDDGNTADGDGCSSTCQVEANFGCLNEPSVCYPAITTILDGELTDMTPTWQRPFSSCTSSSSERAYQTFTFTNTSAQPTRVHAGASFGDFGGYVHAFLGTFDPTMPTVNCEEGASTSFSNPTALVDGIEVPAGETLTVVVSATSTSLGVFAAAIFPGNITCGDGVEQTSFAENCDDSNTNPGDGCSEFCRVEQGWVCGSDQVCMRSCGDGTRNGTDECDDGNTTDGDGCSSDCEIEDGYGCTTASPSVCTPTCGNGELDAEETCDDGNTTAGDGCDTMCQVETGFGCIAEPSRCFAALADHTGAHTDMSPTWSRPIANCTGSNAGRLYDSYTYTNPTMADLEVTVGATFSDYDGYVHAFVGTFDPMMPTTNCDSGDDDYGNRNSSYIESPVTIPAGETLTVVVSTYSTTNRGVFSSAVFGPNFACGSGRVDDGAGFDETCDDGNNMAGDGCDETCSIEDGYVCDDSTPQVCEIACGNGAVDTGETCDDGNTTAGDGCSDACALEAGYVCDDSTPQVCEIACGNGAVDSGETCDDGNTTAGDGCSDSCALEAGYVCTGSDPQVCALSCGDGVINGADVCDDGNTTAGDGCSDSCTVEMGWECTGAPSSCNTICGNGVLNEGERCDDGNSTDGDGCNSTCQTEENFGCIGEPSACYDSIDEVRDGVLDAMDMTWNRPSAGCGVGFISTPYDTFVYTNTSMDAVTVDVGATFGDFNGFVHTYVGSFDPAMPTANCNGATNNFEGSHSSIARNVMIPAGETLTVVISAASASSVGVYSAAISTVGANCGDGITQSALGEACDDGNTTAGDGCDAVCTVEAGNVCHGTPSVCGPPCGNGFLDAGETCDDGNTTAGDGCDAMCAVEAGNVCHGEPSVCGPPCGNGILDGSETCDDGNTAAGDGCSAACTPEPGYACGGTPSVCVVPVCGNGTLEPSEVCDDGNTVDGDGCQADCRSAVFTGTLASSDPTWDRPGATCTSSGGRTGVRHNTVPFSWAGGDQQLYFTVTWTFDGYLHVYNRPFDPSDRFNNCIAGDDDHDPDGSGPLFSSRGSQVVRTIPGGSDLELVLSSYSTGTGDWSVVVSLDDPT